jgi:hypothetical protein
METGCGMRVLVACEYSGIVRDAFIAKGHDAMSCDLLPTESPGPHYQGDVFNIINDGWDMMIAHPPCTYLSYVGNRHWNNPGREELREDALDFFVSLAFAPIPKIAIENPVGYSFKRYRKPDQIIHPYYFGDDKKKKTALWLIGLPKLYYQMEDNLFHKKTAADEPKPIYFLKTTGKGIHHTEAIKGGKKRSRFWPSIAKAMAEQWG